MGRDLLAKNIEETPRSKGRDLFASEERGFPGASFIEPALAIATSIPATAAAGVTGAVAGAFGGSNAAEAVREKVQDTFSFEPRTDAGKQGLKTTGEIVKFLGDAFVNVPASGILGMAELVSNGFDFEEAANTVRSTQKQGISKELGDQAFEATGNPAAATLAELIPDIAGTALGLKGVQAAGKAAPAIKAELANVATEGAQAIESTGKALSVAKDTVGAIKLPAQKEIARRLQAGDIDADNAMFELSKTGVKNPTEFQSLLGLDLPTIKKNMGAVKASRQGFEEAFIGDVRNFASKTDLIALNKMTDFAQKGSKSNIFKEANRPSYVAGDLLLAKVNKIKQLNKVAGQQIGNAAKSLKGQTIDASRIGDNFNTVLDSLKVKITGDKLNFEDSIVSGAGRRKAIADIYGRMVRNKNPDALDLHELKQYIDETVSYGKTVRGLGGKAERALKDLRFDIKTTLEEKFPSYATANKTYSETIEILDEMQRLAGKRTDLTSDAAGGQLASLARRVTSEAQSKSQVVDAFKSMEDILTANASRIDSRAITGKGGTPKAPSENISLLMDYANQLDRITGSSARTGFTGATETAIQAARGPMDFIADKAIESAKGIAGVTPENAYKAMNEFLKGELKKGQK